jgi:hypothetical protein
MKTSELYIGQEFYLDLGSLIPVYVKVLEIFEEEV